MQPKEKIIHLDIPLRPWEVLGVDVFHLNNKNYLCIIDYHSKFPVIEDGRVINRESNHNNKSYLWNVVYCIN